MKHRNININNYRCLNRLILSRIAVEVYYNKLNPLFLTNRFSFMKSNSVYNVCGLKKCSFGKFVYNGCGFPIPPIPINLNSKLIFAHPSPLIKNILTQKRTAITSKFSRSMGKVKGLISYCCINLAGMVDPIISLFDYKTSDINNDITTTIDYTKLD